MIEWLAAPIIIAGAAMIPKPNMSDKKKIETVFKNRKVGINKVDSFQYPKLIKQNHNNTHSTYTYSLPYGIPSDSFEALIPSISEALNKESEYVFEDGVLKLNVFNEKLPDKWTYDKTLLRPGSWEVPIGKNHTGILYHDFEKYCHLLNGGVTRFGKTVFMKEVMNTLILNNQDDVEIFILDLKAGLEFYKYKALPQVKDVACDVYESAELLYSITEELKKREVMFREKGYSNIIDTPIKKRTFIFVDEGAELSPSIVKTKEARKYAEFCQGALSEIARIGGGLGFRLIFATQYPTAEAVPRQVKMNMVARIAFKIPDGTASRVILDELGAETLDPIPGRAIYKLAESHEMQCPFITDKMIGGYMNELGENRTDIVHD